MEGGQGRERGRRGEEESKSEKEKTALGRTMFRSSVWCGRESKRGRESLCVCVSVCMCLPLRG